MTEKAFREFDLLAKYARDPQERKVAAVFAGQLREYRRRGVISANLKEAGVPDELIEGEQDFVHSLFAYDSDTRKVTNKITGLNIIFTPREGLIFEALSKECGNTVLQRKLEIAAGWERYMEKGTSPLPIKIVHIRKKLNSIITGNPNKKNSRGFIVTVNGQGYALIDPAVPGHVEKYKHLLGEK